MTSRLEQYAQHPYSENCDTIALNLNVPLGLERHLLPSMIDTERNTGTITLNTTAASVDNYSVCMRKMIALRDKRLDSLPPCE
jgi:hypothetical protein